MPIVYTNNLWSRGEWTWLFLSPIPNFRDWLFFPSFSTSMSSATPLIAQKSSKTCSDLLFVSNSNFCFYVLHSWQLQCHMVNSKLFYSQWSSLNMLSNSLLSLHIQNVLHIFWECYFGGFRHSKGKSKARSSGIAFLKRSGERGFLTLQVLKPLFGHLGEMNQMLTPFATHLASCSPGYSILLGGKMSSLVCGNAPPQVWALLLELVQAFWHP